MTDVDPKDASSDLVAMGHHSGLEYIRGHSELEVIGVQRAPPERWAYYYSPWKSEEPGASGRNRILGLGKRTFWFLILLAVAVVGAAVGGGVGGALAVQKAKSQAEAKTSSTSTSVTYSEPPSYTPSLIDILPSPTLSTPVATPTPSTVSCPPDTVVPASADHSVRFKCENATDLSAGDIVGIETYSLQTCIDACAYMNRVNNKTLCIAVTVWNIMQSMYPANLMANCWLKGNGTGVVSNATFTSARLCEGRDGCDKLVEAADPVSSLGPP